jgi:hypothetical protein
MSTNDVPGCNPNNSDELAMGCWAEAKDGSLLLIESVEGDRVIYSIFNTAVNPPMEYRDAMPLNGFEDHFSYCNNKKPLGGVWTWHDKTPFPWDRVIRKGIADGTKFVNIDDQITAAARVIEARNLIDSGKPITEEKKRQFMERVSTRGRAVLDKVQMAISELRS